MSIRIRPLLPLALLALAGLPVAASERVPSRTEHRTERLAFGAKLWVKNVDGFVHVSGWDKEEVDLQADLYDSSRGESVRLEVNRKDDGLEIQVVHPKHHVVFGYYRSAEANLTLRVPQRILAHLRTVDGDIRVSRIEGYAKCETVDGDVALEDLKGEAHVRTVDGRIEAHRLNARLKGGTVDGKVFLEQVDGGVDLDTVDGSIRAEGLDGWGEGIRLHTVDGAIDLKLGKASGRIEASTTDGRIDLSVPTAKVLEQKARRLKAEVPGRTQAIHLSTVDGHIRIDA